MFEIRPYLLDGSLRSGDLLAAAGVTRETLANAYRREAREILRFGRARATRYAARQTLPGLDANEFPVFRVDESGDIHSAGDLVTLAATESVWLPDTTVVDGLPPEMHDIAPRGFLGRSFARHHADLGVPANASDWSDNHVLLALSRRGEDLPGNLVVGRESFDRFQTLRPRAVTSRDFPRLSTDALEGEHVGSSAGGEQPKFTAFVDGRHRIVKFATNTTDNARRWRDLLALEHVALETLADADCGSASSEIVDVDGLRCLVIDRFDRIGEMGRRAVSTLAAVVEQGGGTWSDAAVRLHADGILGDDGLRQIVLLDAFGAWIANSDRHHHNIALFPTAQGYEVAPAFDQLPMAYAPPASGNFRNAAIPPPRPTVITLDVWDEAHRLAHEFWRRAAGLSLTDSMRSIVEEHAGR